MGALSLMRDTPIQPVTYQAMLSKGLDVDWAKTGNGMDTFSDKIVQDFVSANLSHARIRVKDNITDSLLTITDQVINCCLLNKLIPVLSFQADFFKVNPTGEVALFLVGRFAWPQMMIM